MNFKKSKAKRIVLLTSILIINTLGSTANASNCNSFPKIFGGSAEDTSIYSFDIFQDKLA
jgi:hypothetical protein